LLRCAARPTNICAAFSGESGWSTWQRSPRKPNASREVATTWTCGAVSKRSFTNQEHDSVFYAAVGVGEDDRHITSIDEDGVALAAIKALHGQNAQLHRENGRLCRDNGQLHVEISRLASSFAALDNRCEGTERETLQGHREIGDLRKGRIAAARRGR
jgi:hypothetical protein